jgi:uncharacterized membrane protein YjjB (DUF3815 family)
LTPWVLGILALTFLAQLGGQHLGSPALGSFLGAIAASLGATTAELVDRRMPRLVVFLPSFWLLVPGSLGLIGVSEVAIAPGQSPTVGLDVLAVIGAIATGLLVGSVVSRMVRVLGRRVRRGLPARRGDDTRIAVEVRAVGGEYAGEDAEAAEIELRRSRRRRTRPRWR